MKVVDTLQVGWNTALEIMNIQFPVGQYNISFWQMFLFFTVMSILFGFIGGALVGRK